MHFLFSFRFFSFLSLKHVLTVKNGQLVDFFYWIDWSRTAEETLREDTLKKMFLEF